MQLPTALSKAHRISRRLDDRCLSCSRRESTNHGSIDSLQPLVAIETIVDMVVRGGYFAREIGYVFVGVEFVSCD